MSEGLFEGGYRRVCIDEGVGRSFLRGVSEGRF